MSPVRVTVPPTLRVLDPVERVSPRLVVPDPVMARVPEAPENTIGVVPAPR